MKKTFIILCLIFTIAILYPQTVNDAPQSNFSPNFSPNFSLGGFIPPDKLKMNHSMSFSSGVSSSGNGFYQSSYTNHMQFMLKPNLKFNLDLSLVNHGTMTHSNNMNFSGNNDNQNTVVPAFSLEYRPTEKTSFYFEYRNINGAAMQPYFMNNDWWLR